MICSIYCYNSNSIWCRHSSW